MKSIHAACLAICLFIPIAGLSATPKTAAYVGTLRSLALDYGLPPQPATGPDANGDVLVRIDNSCGTFSAVYEIREVLVGDRLGSLPVRGAIGEWCRAPVPASRDLVLLVVRKLGGSWQLLRTEPVLKTESGLEVILPVSSGLIGTISPEPLLRRLPSRIARGHKSEYSTNALQDLSSRGIVNVDGDVVYFLQGIYLEDIAHALRPN